MTRREEITRESWKRYPNSPERNFGTGDYEYPEYHDAEREAFEKGAYWADKTMIEKATQWLFEHVYDYLNPEDQERVESFRKYLEE